MIKIRTCFCLFDISILCFNENLCFNVFAERCNELNKKTKWFCHFDNIYYVTCLDFIMQTENELPLDILIWLDEVCDQDDRFIDDADTNFFNCLAYTLSMDNFDLKKISSKVLFGIQSDFI